ncbi:hypothetical protein QJS10_CPB20g00408 [Acorus calamus]|uniref:Uncharacterized protein n=1 Tax=Acorus calamus TaxID=4465 RepID=A0AAV9CD01_ACOCL|nr:hypothetical protein QJS10_CPB20g00408 [Acorus calamus]
MDSISFVDGLGQLCFDYARARGDPLDVLDLVEVWEADDEIASVLLSRLSDLNVECAAWPTRVLCSVVLPKLLVLERPASRVLAAAVIDYCKVLYALK